MLRGIRKISVPTEKGKTMIDEYDKCRFCKSYDEFWGSRNCFCEGKEEFIPNKQKIIEKSKDTGLSVTDIVALMELERRQ